MALGLDDLIDELRLKYLHLGSDFNDCSTRLRLAGEKLMAGQPESAGFFLDRAAGDMAEAAIHVYSATNGIIQWHTWLYERIDFFWPDVEPLSAKTICEAWAKNGFEDRALTIAFIDRMRQLIWDEPFSVVWAARPETGG